MQVRRFLLALLLLANPARCMGAEALHPTEEQALDRRVTAISEVLPCLVCQNQTIADSQAELAVDLKKQIRERLKAGMSEPALVDYMVARYGDFVLYRPQLKKSTVVLWFGPFALLAGAFVYFLCPLRHRKEREREVPLNGPQRARARKILGD